MAGMRDAWRLSAGQQLGLLDDAARTAAQGAMRSVPPPPRKAARDRLTIDLRVLGPRLRAYAEAHGKTPTTTVRQALLQLLSEASEWVDSGEGAPSASADANEVVKVTLRLPATQARSLALRARAADVSQGVYMCALLKGSPPPPLPADHAAAIQVLRASTDRLAAMSADINSFVRLVPQGKAAVLDRYRTGLMSLSADVRAHLACAAALIAELRPARSPTR